MIPLLLSACLLLAWEDPPKLPAAPSGLSPADVVAALETAVGDAIAKAEQSVVAIHRFKTENGQETLAVRGKRHRSAPRELPRRFVFNGRLSPLPDETDIISFDFGSGVVIGDHGEILTAFHVVRVRAS